MKEVFIMEKSEFVGLSVLIAERIIGQSKKFYGFKIVSRDTNRELSDDGMIGVLSPAIRNALKELGARKMKPEEYYTEEEVDDIVSDHEALKEYLYGWDDAIKDGCFYKKKYVDQYANR